MDHKAGNWQLAVRTKVAVGMLAATVVTGVALSAASGSANGVLLLLPVALLALAALAASVKDGLRLTLAGTLLAALGVWLRYFYLLLLTLGCDDDGGCYADRSATASAWGVVFLAALAVPSSLAIALMARTLRRRHHG